MIEIVKMKVKDLQFDPDNLRHHGNENIEMIKKSLTSYQQYKPLIVDKKSNVVKIGNGRLRAMKELGWEECWCVLIDFSDHKGMEILDNRLNELSKWKDLDLNDWLLNYKGLDWWGVDSHTAVELQKSEKRKKQEKQTEKHEHEARLCPCCGHQLKKSQVILL